MFDFIHFRTFKKYDFLSEIKKYHLKISVASRDRTRLNSSVHKLSLGLKLKPSTGILNLLSNPQRICFFRAFHRLFDSFTIRAFTDTDGTWPRLKYGYDKPCLWSYSWRDLGQAWARLISSGRVLKE